MVLTRPQCPRTWLDEAWWGRRLDAALAAADPARCNRCITLAHHELSLALRSVLGEGCGANFHTWATWGSLKAGTTIRQADIPGLRPLAALVGGALGWVAAAALGAPALGPLAAALGAAVALLLVAYGLRRSADAILAGNRTVLDDIGRVTARYVALVGASPDDPRAFARFLGTLRPGATHAGGQDLLARAFRHYEAARRAAEPKLKHEHALLANLLVILHEHIRLDPFIARALPRPLRRPVTRLRLRFRAGRERFDAGCDVPRCADGAAAPPTLRQLALPELREFLHGAGGWDRTGGRLAGSGARDWTRLPDRRGYIVHLFRSRHLAPDLLAHPEAADRCPPLGRPARGALRRAYRLSG